VDTASVLSLSLDARGSADGAASDNDTVADETNGPPAKYRKLPCSEPPPPFPGRRAELAAALAARGAVYLPPGAAAVEDFARSVVAAEQADDLFYVYDLSVVDRLHGAWVRAMPRVEPFYAVKCNPDDGILAVLAALGAGFDCASEAEIAQVLAHGVSPDRIIYAHPCKPAKQLRWAAAAGVGLTTFDTESELRKVAAHHPGAALLLRIRADDPSARCQLGNKYGADAEDVPALLRLARDLGLGVRGVSFHVGSGAKSASAFWNAIAAARAVFDAGHALGFDMSVLDIGGGFCGGTASAGGAGDLGGVPAAVNAALAAFFPEDGNVRVIAEPGRYFAEGSATFACVVNGWRARRAAAPDAGPTMDYFISDGLYGSMNCLLYDHADLQPRAMRSPLLPAATEAEDAVLSSTLFGPTCDGMDTVVRGAPLPRLRNGDWVLFPRFGECGAAAARPPYCACCPCVRSPTEVHALSMLQGRTPSLAPATSTALACSRLRASTPT
jgi:ornithine decarboxylase